MRTVLHEGPFSELVQLESTMSHRRRREALHVGKRAEVLDGDSEPHERMVAGWVERGQRLKVSRDNATAAGRG